MLNFYDVLEVSKDASLDEIKNSYYRLSKQYHPDRAGKKSTSKMQEVTQAYQTLSNPALRVAYDINISGITKEDFLCKVNDVPLLPHDKDINTCIYKKCYDEYKSSFKPTKKLNNLKDLVDRDVTKKIYQYNNKSFFSIYELIHEKERNHEPCTYVIDQDRQLDVFFVTKLITDFLHGNIFGLALENFKQSLASAIETSNYLKAVYGIICVDFTDQRSKSLLINSFKELTNYLINTTDELSHEQTLLFASKEFHALQSLAHAIFWQDLNILESTEPDGQTTTSFFYDHFDGSNECFEHLKHLKSSVIDNDPRLLLFNNLMYFEMNVSHKVKGINKSTELREFAFKILNWITYLTQSSYATPEILANMYLQAGTYLIVSARGENNLPDKFADETLAFNLFEIAVAISNKLSVLPELYALNNVIGNLLKTELIGAQINDKLRLYIIRFDKISKIYPFFHFIQSATELTKQVPQFQNFQNKFLKSLYEAYHTEGIGDNNSTMSLTYTDILYEIYVCCLNGNYYHNIESEEFYKIRFELINSIVASNGYTLDPISQNLSQPTVMVKRTIDGWLSPAPQQIPFPMTNSSSNSYQSLNSVVISLWNGDINFDLLPSDGRPETQLITLADIVHIFTRRITEARFSLDEVDHNRPYLPFYQMTYSPLTLAGTDFLRTLFLTDYLLKIFTVGQDVNSKPDYRLIKISNLIGNLPHHLRKIIDDYHRSEPSENNTHRFWIETENAETVFKKFTYDKVITIGDIKMVVKKQAMTRDKDGKLIDDINDHEGWDIYILKPSKLLNIFQHIFMIFDTIIIKILNIIKHIFKILERIMTSSRYNTDFDKITVSKFIASKGIRRPSIIINHENEEAYFFESGKISDKFDLSSLKQTIQELKKLDRDKNYCIKFKNQKREIQEKIYLSILDIANKTNKKHYFSREYVFTYEFTKNYEEFGRYFPEFLRLRELAKICLYIEHMELIHGLVKDSKPGNNLLTDILVSHTKLNQSFEKIGIGSYKNTDYKVCPLVPASFNRQTTQKGIHFSYGGVRVKPTSFPLHWRTKSASEQFIEKNTNRKVYKCDQNEYSYARDIYQHRAPPQRTEFRQEPQASFFAKQQQPAQTRTTETSYTSSTARTKSAQPAQPPCGSAATASARAGGFAAGGNQRSGKPPSGFDTTARNAADAVRHRTELTLKQHNILDMNGKLTSEALAASYKLIDGTKISNPSVIKALTSDGSKIDDWVKKTTKSVNMSTGQSIQVHFYQNKKTGEVNYTHQDYKVKGFIDPSYEQYYKKQHDPKVREFVNTYK